MGGTSGVSGGAVSQLGGYYIRDTNGDKISDQISQDGKTWVSASSASGAAMMAKAMTASIGPIIAQTKAANNSGNTTVMGAGSSGVSKAILPAAKAVSDAASSVASALNPLKWTSALLDILNRFLSPGFWERIGFGALGFFLIIFGVVFMVESNKTARSITGMVTP